MTTCPVCFGEGEHDFRDSDLALLPLIRDGLIEPLGIVECPECDGAGYVDEERARDIRAAAVAYVDQALARLHHRGLLPLPKEEA